MNQRGVSPVVGMVLLVGLTSIVAVGLLTVGFAIADSTSSAAETQQVASSMEQFADHSNQLSDGTTDTESFTVSGSESGTASVDPDAGRLQIYHNGTDRGNRTLYDDSLGEYRYDVDGTTFAYQGGGVWRAEEHGDPQLVTPPAFEYRRLPDATLNFPIMRVTGDATGNGATDGTLTVQDRRTIYPRDALDNNPLQGGEVYVDIQSEYCAGWQEHVESRTDGIVVEECDETGTTGEGELRTGLNVPTPGNVSAAAIATEELSPSHGGAGQVDGPVVVPDASNIGSRLGHGDVTEKRVELPDTEVDSKVAGCPSFNTTVPSEINESGTYCFTEIHHDDLTIRPENGSVTIVARDRITIDSGAGGITVENNTGDNNDVKIYSGGDFFYKSDDFGNEEDPSQTSLYSDHEIKFQGSNARGYAFVLSSGSETSDTTPVEVNADAILTGAAMSTTIHVQGNGSTIRWDPGMDGMPVGAEEGDNPIYYLHVSETSLEVAD